MQTPPADDVFSAATTEIMNRSGAPLRQEMETGIAAPHVGITKQILIVALKQTIEPPYDNLETGLVVINPSIKFNNKQADYEWEGCLSIPGIRGYVPRICDITITYTNRHGELKSEQYSEFIARIFLHEYDHLQGVLFIDRVEDIKRDLITDDYYKHLMEEEE